MQFDCFLTHDWGTDELDRDNHARVSQVCVRLKDAGFKPWFDEEFMRGDVNKTMTDALSRSRCVIVFITNRYVEKASGNGEHGANDNCKFEFDTALMPPLGVDKMISVVMEPRCRSPGNWPKGTVRGKLGPKLYLDLADDGAGFDRGIERLITELRATIPEAPGSSGAHPQPIGRSRKLTKQSSFEKLKSMVVGGSTKQVSVVDVSDAPSPANRKLKKQSSFERLRGLLPGGSRKHAAEGTEACAWLSLEQQHGGDGGGSLTLTVHDEGSAVLRHAASRAVNLVSVCGRLGTGKSYLMNALAQQPNTFGVSSGAKSFTIGAHLGPALMEFSTFSGRPSPPTSSLLGFVDMEGQVAA